MAVFFFLISFFPSPASFPSSAFFLLLSQPSPDAAPGVRTALASRPWPRPAQPGALRGCGAAMGPGGATAMLLHRGHGGGSSRATTGTGWDGTGCSGGLQEGSGPSVPPGRQGGTGRVPRVAPGAGAEQGLALAAGTSASCRREGFVFRGGLGPCFSSGSVSSLRAFYAGCPRAPWNSVGEHWLCCPAPGHPFWGTTDPSLLPHSSCSLIAAPFLLLPSDAGRLSVLGVDGWPCVVSPRCPLPLQAHADGIACICPAGQVG